MSPLGKRWVVVRRKSLMGATSETTEGEFFTIRMAQAKMRELGAKLQPYETLRVEDLLRRKPT